MRTSLRSVPLLVLACSSTVALAQPRMTDVVVRQAEMRDLPATTVLVGTVEPLRRSVVGNEVGGIVDDVPIRQGDSVEAGEVLAKLNIDVIGAELLAAKAMLSADEATLRKWEFEVKRIERLFGNERANEKEVYDATAERDRAKWLVEQQKAEVSRLETIGQKTIIRAPFGGFVVRRMTEVGEWLDRGGAVAELVDLSEVLVRVDVPESALPYVQTGDKANVLVEALDRSFEGTVRHVMRQADPAARTFPVEIVVSNEEKMMAAGMFVRATVIVGPTRQVVAIPKDALVERDGVRYVGMVVPGQQGELNGLLMPITTGSDVGEWTAVTSGNVREGAQVIVRGTERLFQFPMPIRVVDEHGRPVAEGGPHGAAGMADVDASAGNHGEGS